MKGWFAAVAVQVFTKVHLILTAVLAVFTAVRLLSAVAILNMVTQG